MLRISSIKQQTLVLLVSLTVGLAVVFFSLAVVTAFMVEDAVLEHLLDEQAALVEQEYYRNGRLPEMSSGFTQLFKSVAEAPGWAQDRIARAQLHGEIFTPDGTHYHYKKFTYGDDTQHTGVVIAEVSRLLAVTNQPQVFALFLLVFSVSVALAAFLAARFSRKIVQPMLDLTEAVKRNENPLPKLEFEPGYLSQSLQISFDKLNLLLEREKAFTTDVSHELRTPLTVLKNSCALITQRGFKVDDLASIKDSCEQMEHIVDVLLALARAESVELQPCNVRLMLEQAILRCKALQLNSFHIHLTVCDKLTLMANARLLELLFFNLLRNAAEHSSEPELTISYANGQLTFENCQEDMQAMAFTHAGTRHADSSGIGQGLYLVARIIERFDWRLDVKISDNRFRVTIIPTTIPRHSTE